VNRRALAGVAMIIGTSASIQAAAAIAHSLFDTLTPAGVSALRFALGTAIVLPVVRPSLRGVTTRPGPRSPSTASRSGS